MKALFTQYGEQNSLDGVAKMSAEMMVEKWVEIYTKALSAI